VNFFLIILSLFVSITAQAVVPSGVPSITLGGADTYPGNLVIPESNIGSTGGYFTVMAGSASEGAGDFYPFWKNGVAYQVTSGKTAYCTALMFAGGQAFNTMQLVSATATFANGASSLTGGVYYCGAAGNYCLGSGTAANTYNPMGVSQTFAATTWPGIQTQATGQIYSVLMSCKEQ